MSKPGSAQGKRPLLVLIILGTAVVLAAIFYLLIDAPRTRLAAQKKLLGETQLKLDRSRKDIGDAARVKVAVDLASRKLQTIETRMDGTRRSVYAWTSVRGRFVSMIDVPRSAAIASDWPALTLKQAKRRNRSG